MDKAASFRPNTQDLWKTALESVSTHDRAELERLATGTTAEPCLADLDRLRIVAECLKLTGDAKSQCQEKAWRFKRKGGQVVIARDVLAKISRWINHFKAVGDTIVQYDPAHAALPWAGFRFILQICVDHFETHEFLLEKLPIIAEQICRCALMEKLLMHSATDTADEFKRVLIGMYANILTFLARVKEYFQKSTRVQVLQSFKQTSAKFESAFKAILDARAELERCFHVAGVQEQLEMLTGLKEAFAKLEAPTDRWSKDLVNITDKLDKSERKEVLQWISKEPYLSHHRRERGNILHGTGQWLVTHPIFKQWKEESSSSILWLRGIPGSGKSKLTSLVVEDAQDSFKKQLAPSPAYFYCSRNPAEPGRSDPEAIIASLVRQFSCARPGGTILEPTIAAYRSHEDDAFAANSLQLQDSTKLLLQLIQGYPVATIIIDALDECQADTRKALFDCLENILHESSTLVKIFVSSRDDGDIVNKLGSYPQLEISSGLNFNDINYFVKFETEARVRNNDLLRFSSNKDELSSKIVERLSNEANGMFRWVTLQLDALCSMKMDSAVLERLGRLPKELNQLYQELLDKITNYEAESDRECAKNALSWLLCSQQQLRSDDFLAAITTSSNPPLLNPNKDQVLDLCCNLIVFDPTLDSFRFAHLSVREFLEQLEAYDHSLIHSLAAQSCLTALMDQKFKNVAMKNPISIDSPLPHPSESFQLYASTYWAQHCQSAADRRRQVPLSTLLEKFFSDTKPGSPFAMWNTAVYHFAFPALHIGHRIESCKSEAIFVASAFDFAEFIQAEIYMQNLTEHKKLQKCMVLAASHGCFQVLSLLLDIPGVILTKKVVTAAARNRESGKDVMALLFEKMGDQVPITEDVIISAAGNTGGNGVMEILLEKRGDVISINENVVKAAAKNKDFGKEMMALLLEKKYNQILITEGVLKTAAANYKSGKHIMELLLDKRGDQVSITEDVVKAAAKNYGGKDVMELLLEKRGDQVSITEDVIKAAANNWGGKDVMELLLAKRGDQVVITEDIVQAAASNLYGEGVMELLLEKRGDQISITEEILEAVASNHERGKDIMEFLLEKRGDQVVITEYMVIAAARIGSKDIMDLLLGRGEAQVLINGDVIEAAAQNFFGKDILKLLFSKKKEQVSITQNAIIAAAKNESGRGMIEFLFEKMGDQMAITEDVVKAAAENASGRGVMEFLFEKMGDQMAVTEDVVKAAAENDSGRGVMELLFEKLGHRIAITKDVVKAVAGNTFGGRDVMKFLFEKTGDRMAITEDVVKAAAGNTFGGIDVMEFLFEITGGQMVITDDVVQAAAGNTVLGRDMMELLFEKTGDQMVITEDVVKAAAGNLHGKGIIELLFEKVGDQMAITEDMLKAAAQNNRRGKYVMALLLEKVGDRMSITEDVLKVAARNETQGKEITKMLLKRRDALR